MMATTRAKSKEKSKTTKTGNTGKSAAASKTVKGKNILSLKQIPSENEIRIKAQEIYNSRLISGLQGSAESDWLQAEKLLKGKKK